MVFLDDQRFASGTSRSDVGAPVVTDTAGRFSVSGWLEQFTGFLPLFGELCTGKPRVAHIAAIPPGGVPQRIARGGGLAMTSTAIELLMPPTKLW